MGKRLTKLFNKQNGMCGYCHTPMIPEGTLLAPTVDHIIPLKYLKDKNIQLSSEYNTVAVHYGCNQIKGSDPLSEVVHIYQTMKQDV